MVLVLQFARARFKLEGGQARRAIWRHPQLSWLSLSMNWSTPFLYTPLEPEHKCMAAFGSPVFLPNKAKCPAKNWGSDIKQFRENVPLDGKLTATASRIEIKKQTNKTMQVKGVTFLSSMKTQTSRISPDKAKFRCPSWGERQRWEKMMPPFQFHENSPKKSMSEKKIITLTCINFLLAAGTSTHFILFNSRNIPQR